MQITANGMVAASFAIANIIGPQTFQAHDAPEYIPAKITVLVTAVLTAMTAVALRILLGYRNKTRRESPDELGAETEAILLADVTDGKNKNFRYIY